MNFLKIFLKSLGYLFVWIGCLLFLGLMLYILWNSTFVYEGSRQVIVNPGAAVIFLFMLSPIIFICVFGSVGIFEIIAHPCATGTIPCKYSDWQTTMYGDRISCIKTRTCSRCGLVESTGTHKYVYESPEATCGDTQTATCEVCGDTYTQTLEHTFSNLTCDKCGAYDYSQPWY
jgi:hypothetical protein